MKGITPIISIIILLLVTVGLAAAAWTYMSNYLTTLTSKTIEVPTQTCITDGATQNIMAIVHNMGTAKITMANDVTILDNQGSPVSGTWTDLDPGNAITEILAGGYGKVSIDCCDGAGEPSCPATCSFDIVVAGRTQKLTVYCPGA